MVPRCSLDPVDARAPLRDIEIDFHHPLLGPDRVGGHGKRQLQPLAYEGPPVPKEKVLRRLHRDGARAPRRLSRHRIVYDGLELIPVDPAVIAELTVLRHHDGAHEIGRYVLEINPSAVITLQCRKIRQHQGRNRSDKLRPVQQDQHIGPKEQKKNCDDYGPENPGPPPPLCRRRNLLVLLQCLDFQYQ